MRSLAQFVSGLENPAASLTRSAWRVGAGLREHPVQITSLDQMADDSQIDAIVNLAGEPIGNR